MTNERLRVGVAQVDTRLGDLEGHLDKHLEIVARAKADGLDLLVFPETSLTGFPHASEDPSVKVHHQALRRDAPALRPIRDAAGDVAVVVGFVEEAPAAQFYNTSIVFRGGETLHIHRKLNLATYGNLEEGKYFAQGRYVDAFQLVPEVWRVAALTAQTRGTPRSCTSPRCTARPCSSCRPTRRRTPCRASSAIPRDGISRRASTR